MRRGSSGTPRGRPRKKDKKNIAVSEEALLWVSDAGQVLYDPFPMTTCGVCGGVEDEDLIILCDGPGCSNEIHMYCLTPAITEVPEGDWFCEACDPSGTTTQLHKYFEDFALCAAQIWSLASNYNDYIMLLQQRQVPFDNWKPTTTGVIRSEFDSSATDLIGSVVRLTVEGFHRHSGRIVNRRWDEIRGRWEHQVQFKGGTEGRNVPHVQWLCLDEHPCLVGGAVRWVRAGDPAFWPALEFYQSGVKLASTLPTNSPTSSAMRPTKRLYYLFGEERVVSLTASDSRYVQPYFAKSKESRLYANKRLNVAYSLATMEREEVQAARRAFCLLNGANADSTEGTLVDGCTTGTLKELVEGHARINNRNAASATTSTSTAASVSAQFGQLEVAENTATASDKLDLRSLNRGCQRHILRYEYCRSVGLRPQRNNMREVKQESAERGESGETTDATPIPGVDIDESATGGLSREGGVDAGLDDAERALCLDRALLAAEGGVGPSRDSAVQASTVLFYMPDSCTSEETSSSLAHAPKSSKRKLVAEEAGSAAEGDVLAGKTGQAKLNLKPFKMGDLIFEKYKADVFKKRDELIARRLAEEQEREVERIQRAAARKAREAKFDVNPWFADGEDFTRKSSRLSSTARPSYSDSFNESDDVVALERQVETVKTDKPSKPKSVCELETVPEPVPEPPIQQDEKPDITVTVPEDNKANNKKSARRSKKRAQEEAEYQEFLQTTADQPRLLSDTDRAAWVGTVVTYLVDSQVGRVTEYRSGWAVVRTVEGSINCRPYQLEVVETDTAAMQQFEDAEMWALCEEERETAPNDPPIDTDGVGGADGADGMDSFEFAEAAELFDGDNTAVPRTDAAGLDESDPMYNAFLNDEDYEAFLLDKFDPATGSLKATDASRRQGAAAARQQQLKPSRTKFLETVPLSEEEKKKRLQALAKKRDQTMQLLRGQKASGSAAPPVRVIPINRFSAGIDEAEAVVQDKPSASAHTSNARDVARNKPLEVMKLGAAPPLARPSYHRDTGNNYRRATTAPDPPRRLSMEGPPTRKDFDRRASLPLPGVSRASKDAFGRDIPGSFDSKHFDHQTTMSAGAGAVSGVSAAQRDSQSASQTKDPRVRMRMERETIRYEPYQPQSVAAPVTAPVNKGTRDTDYRSMKNASADVRTAKANIGYLQEQFLSEKDVPKKPAPSATTAKKVNFGATSNFIVGSFIDDDVLNITGDDDRGYFSPASVDDEEAEDVSMIRAPATAPMKSIDRAPTTQRENSQSNARVSRFSDNIVTKQDPPVPTTDLAPSRKSRFGPPSATDAYDVNAPSKKARTDNPVVSNTGRTVTIGDAARSTAPSVKIVQPTNKFVQTTRAQPEQTAPRVRQEPSLQRVQRVYVENSGRSAQLVDRSPRDYSSAAATAAQRNRYGEVDSHRDYNNSGRSRSPQVRESRAYYDSSPRGGEYYSRDDRSYYGAQSSTTDYGEGRPLHYQQGRNSVGCSNGYSNTNTRDFPTYREGDNHYGRSSNYRK